MQNIVAVIVLVSIGWAFYRRLVSKPRRLTFNRDALIILGDDRRRRRDRAVRPGLRGRRATATIPGAFVSNALAVPLRNLSSGDPRPGVRTSCGGATSRWSPRSCATCRSASTCTSRRPSRTSSSASSRRAASCRSSTSRTRTRRSGSRRSRTSAGRTCSTASPAPNAVAARRPARPTTPASRSTPRN